MGRERKRARKRAEVGGGCKGVQNWYLDAEREGIQGARIKTSGETLGATEPVDAAEEIRQLKHQMRGRQEGSF